MRGLEGEDPEDASLGRLRFTLSLYASLGTLSRSPLGNPAQVPDTLC